MPRKSALIIVDVQNDFITGSLANQYGDADLYVQVGRRASTSDYAWSSAVAGDDRVSVLHTDPSFCSEWGFNLALKDADGTDVAAMGVAGELDRRLKQRGLSELSYYDGITHTRMFSLNRTVRERCEKEDRVMTVENPLFMCTTETHATVFEAGGKKE